MKITRPVFIIGSYRGGTSLLFRLLSESKELWSMYRESNHLWKDYYRNPEERSDTIILERKTDGSFINKVTSQSIFDLEKVKESFDKHYHYSTYNSYKLGYLGRVKTLRESFSWIFDLINIFNFISKAIFTHGYRIIDKTPPNMYRVEFLKALYPDAQFIYLVRDKKDNVDSLVSAWCHPEKFKYLYRKYLGEVSIENYLGKVWKFFIPADYKNWMTGKTIEEVCTHQYEDAHQAAERAFRLMKSEDYIRVEFEALLFNPEQEIKKICEFIGVKYTVKMQYIVKEMPAVNTDKVVPA